MDVRAKMGYRKSLNQLCYSKQPKCVLHRTRAWPHTEPHPCSLPTTSGPSGTARLHEGKIPSLVGVYFGLSTVQSARLMVSLGFDAAWIDSEHFSLCEQQPYELGCLKPAFILLVESLALHLM